MGATRFSGGFIYVRVCRRVKNFRIQIQIHMEGDGSLMTALVMRKALMKHIIMTNIVLHAAFYFMHKATILCRVGTMDHPS